MTDNLRPSPVSLRLSKVERAALERRAGGSPLSTYVKSVLFEDGSKAKGRRRVSADQVLLAQILGQLGASGLASSLGRLAAAADSGSLHVDDLTIQHLRDAFNEVRGMHQHLMRALGKKVPNAGARPERLRVTFARAAVDAETQP